MHKWNAQNLLHLQYSTVINQKMKPLLFRSVMEALQKQCYTTPQSRTASTELFCHQSFLSTSSLCCIFLSAYLRPIQTFSLAARSFDHTMWSVSANVCAACIAAPSGDITVTHPRPDTHTHTHNQQSTA